MNATAGTLYDHRGNLMPPVSASISRAGAGQSGTLSNWYPRRLSRPEEGRQRERLVDRANDLALNHPHAASLVDSITVNTVGIGLWPQSKPAWKRLGITEEQAREVAEQVEWEFEQWATREADAREVTDFYGIQFQNIWSMLVNGEFVNLPLMIDNPDRDYSLAIQTVDPVRLRTPLQHLHKPDIRDGIRLGPAGNAVSYFLAEPDDGIISRPLDLRHFRELPRRRGHRPVVIHRFHVKQPEQTRGVSVLAPSMKFFRDVSDYLDFELVGAIVAASFPVWIEKQQATDINNLPGMYHQTEPNGQVSRYQELAAGQVAYGNPGEKPHILKSDRPGSSFSAFIETILRAVGASAGMPYEVIAKDFSKTNYSSARAALEEAWRVFGLYQDWLVNHFCRVIWEMLFEEAWLRGRIKLPKGSPDFYAARTAWTNAGWVVPERTSLDPVKEIVAAVMAKQHNLGTDADFAAKRGKDWEATYEQRARERNKAAELDLPESTDPPTVKKRPDPNTDPDAGAEASNIIHTAVSAAIRETIQSKEPAHE